MTQRIDGNHAVIKDEYFDVASVSDHLLVDLRLLRAARQLSGTVSGLEINDAELVPNAPASSNVSS